MFNGTPPPNPFSIGKLIGGISKTLNVANQVIPLYKEAKPMLQNARNAINIIKEFTNNTTNRVMDNKDKNIRPIKEKIETIKNTNNIKHDLSQNKKGPTFFQ